MEAAVTPHRLVVLLLLAAGAARAEPPQDGERRRADLVERMERSAVAVRVEGRGVERGPGGVILEPSRSVASGVVLSADGLILTAAHVVADAEALQVGLPDGTSAPARPVFADESADVALLRVEPSRPLVPARLGTAAALRKGETLYVIGSPGGFERSVSAGVMSGRRPLPHLVGGSVPAELIQTDAAMNPGNSGGAIFDSRGQVVALALLIVTEGGGSEGLGFGLSIDVVKKILGLDPCVWLGFSAIPLDAAWAEALNVPAAGAFLVQRVARGSPAARAGLRGGSLPAQSGSRRLLLGGDVVLAVNGAPLAEWAATLGRRTGPDEVHEVVATVLRAGRTLELRLQTPHRGAF